MGDPAPAKGPQKLAEKKQKMGDGSSKDQALENL
jgi:hypothetical protein